MASASSTSSRSRAACKGGFGLQCLGLADLQAGAHLVQAVLGAVVTLIELADPAHLLLGPDLLGIGRADFCLGLADEAQLLDTGGGEVIRRRLVEVQIGPRPPPPWSCIRGRRAGR